MNLPFLFARRYLLAKRSQNAVNIITLISIGVIMVVTAAMVVVLSAVNGISEYVDTIYSPFDQDITITPAEGKTFSRDSLDLKTVGASPAVLRSSWVIEENVLLRCGDQQAVATLKGVEPQYMEMSDMQRYMYTGDAKLEGRTGPTAILGLGLKVDLNAPLDDGVFQPLEISAPIRGRKLSKYQQGAFENAAMAVSGAYSMNMEFDSKYAVVPLDIAADLLHYDSLVTGLEVQLKPGSDMEQVAEELQGKLGGKFLVRSRHQKNALMFQTNATEKFVAFLVLVFIGLIGAFNIIASLTMMMIEKQTDMKTILSMGATPITVRRVFLNEGLLITFTGVVIGLAVGVGICWAQERFELIPLSGSLLNAYPVKVQLPDLGVIFATVLGIGLLASWVPLRTLSRRFLQATAAKA
ncbi:MAG: FtsX-like permease family protein [Flavobacteriales bacterium]